MSKEEVAACVKSAREYRGYSQNDVAAKLKITYQAVSNYERSVNRIPTGALQSLCDLYGISVDSVLKSRFWHDSLYEDFTNCKDSETQLRIVQSAGVSDPRLICECEDLLRCVEKKPATPKGDELPDLDRELISLMCQSKYSAEDYRKIKALFSLSPEEIRRVLDFAEGLIAAREN